jgi:hypothetical protein
MQIPRIAWTHGTDVASGAGIMRRAGITRRVGIARWVGIMQRADIMRRADITRRVGIRRRAGIMPFAALASLTVITLLTTITARAQTVYAAVWGDPRSVVGSSTLNSGLFRSADRGRTWTHLGPQNLKTFSMDAVDSSRGRILFIAAGNGIHRSLDSGRTWRIVTDWRITEVLDVLVDQSNPRRLYAATAFGVRRSSDGGDTWDDATGAASEGYASALLRRGDSIVHVVDPSTNMRVPRLLWSIDHGATWRAEPGGVIDPPRRSIDSSAVMTVVAAGADSLAGTWGRGVYRGKRDDWTPSGLEGTQLWRLIVKEY